MPVTPQELDDFTRFAAERLRHGENLPSLEECLRQWRADLEFQEAVAHIRESLDECSHGRLKPLDQALDDLKRQLGLISDVGSKTHLANYELRDEKIIVHAIRHGAHNSRD